MKANVVTMLIAVLLASPHVMAQVNACGDLKNHYGPLDYRTAPQSERDLIENYHFTPKVAALKEGQSTTYIGADIAYTLRVFPNHPRALYAMAELARREKRPTPEKAGLSVECWFERAMRFRPDDGAVHIIYGIELLKDGRREQAVQQLERGLELLPDSGNAHYNVGLAYFDLGDYVSAREHAKKAKELGYTLPGLQRKLEKMGKWE